MNSSVDFKKQIESDIKEYQEKYGKYMKDITKPEWAFNFWIMDKFFYIDENEIQQYIIDYNDKGIDCYYYYDDTKELYLIQNKYYSTTPLTGSYLNDDVFSRSINLLRSGTYTRSKELQQIYNINKNNPKFKVYIQIYVANDVHDKSVEDAINNFNNQTINQQLNTTAEVFYLEDIYSKYYDEEVTSHQTFEYTLKRINKDTTLTIKAEELKLSSMIDSIYMVIPIIDIYEMIKESKNENYNLVRENIRDYMGKTQFNSDIADTLENEDERDNFMYYNNGITIICDRFSSGRLLNQGKYTLYNPQIVNGCQTVNTIYEVLFQIADEKEIMSKYSNCYVMAKILIIDDDNKKQLYRNIVTYNNSQNKIDKKVFEAIQPRFLRLKNEYRKKGFLLCVRPSDSYQYGKEFQHPTMLLSRAEKFLDIFGLNYAKTKDFYITIDKFLQVILAYVTESVVAVQKKSRLLKDSEEYKLVRDFILKDTLNNDLLMLYLLYQRLEQEKSTNGDGRFPISFFVIDGLSRYECQGGKISISEALSTSEKVNEIVEVYTDVSKKYYDYFKNLDEKNDYNTMIKTRINYEKFQEIYYNVKSERNKKKSEII